MRLFLKLLSDERGAGTIEFALIAFLISIGAITAMTNVASEVNERYAAVEAVVDQSM